MLRDDGVLDASVRCRWKNNIYNIYEPAKAVSSVDELLYNILCKCHYKKIMRRVKGTDRAGKFEMLMTVLQGCAVVMFQHNLFRWKPTSIASTNGMAIYFTSTSKFVASCQTPKRTNGLKPEWAAKMIDVEDFAFVVPQPAVDAIISLKLEVIQ